MLSRWLGRTGDDAALPLRNVKAMTATEFQGLFSDGIHWRVFDADAEGNVWLTDYPHAEYHGGGTPRRRVLKGSTAVLVAFHSLLRTLGEHSQALHENASICTPHLASIGEVAEALAERGSAESEVASAIRTFGWSYLPDTWGEAVESSWVRFLWVAGSETLIER